jgi:2-polyprenyl-3-methyl-5-hydroxy-6-metoxy-1,4-benzoquinol methylase
MIDDAWGEEFRSRRKAASEELDAIYQRLKSHGDAKDQAKWHAMIYEFAGEDAAQVPWARLAPNPLLADWLTAHGPLSDMRALDVGCGLGDNAEALARAGANVMAFDYIPRAIDWAKRRFPDLGVDYRVADLFAPPEEWRGAFDLVHECYTLQAVDHSLLSQAAASLAAVIAPRGALLIVTTAREENEAVDTRWRPLTRKQIESFAIDGLALETLDDIPRQDETPRHWRALLRRMKSA